MKLGFSLLSLFMKDVNEMLDIAVENGFDSVELLAEGPYRPDEMLGNKEITEVFHSYIDLMKCLETRKSLKSFTHMTWTSICMQ